jgi:hypothetical protein
LSYVSVSPDRVKAAAGNLDGIRSLLTEANAAAAPPTTGIAPPAMDQVSAAIAAALGTHALEYQTVSAQVADFHEQFVGALSGSAGQYLSAEVANAEQALLNAVNAPAQLLLGHSSPGTGAAAAPGGTGSPAVTAGAVPAAGTGEVGPASYPGQNSDILLNQVKVALTGAAGLATGVVSLTSGSLNVPAGLSLGVDAIGPYLSTASALQSGGTAISNALSSVRPVAAATALAHTPANAVKGFLQDATSESTASPADSESPSPGVGIPVAGLLDPAPEDHV